MATIKYDNTDVETGGGGTPAQPGMYAGEIVSVTHRTSKADGSPANDLEVVVDIGPDYRRMWSYIGLGGNTAWKMREFTDALSLPPKGELTAQKLKSLSGKKVNVKVSADTDLDGEYRGKIKNLFRPGEGGETSNGSSASGGDGGDQGYDGMSIEDLVAEIEERGLDVPSGRKTIAKLVTVLEEADEAAGGESQAGDDTAPLDDYDEWDEQDLKDEIEAQGLTGNLPSGRQTKAKLIAFLRENADGGAAANPDAPDAPEDDYDEWPDDDLRDEVASRQEQGVEIKITGRPNRDKWLAVLREDDANATAF